MTSGDGPEERAGMLAAAAAVTIDLPTGLPMAGYARRDQPSAGTLRPLEARAIAFGDARGTRAVAIVLDLLYVTAAICRRIEQVVSEETGVPPAAIVVSATHTHSGPSVGDPDEAIGRLVVDAAGRAGRDALARLEPAVLRTEQVGVGGIGVNRRDGSAPRLEASVLIASRPADPTDVICVALGFGCHATVLEHDNLSYSPDYPGYARDQLEALVGGTAVFVQGAGADINPVFHAHTPAAARTAGTLLAVTVAERLLRGLRDAADPQYVNLSWNDICPIPRRTPLRRLAAGRIDFADGEVTVGLSEPIDAEKAAPALEDARRRWKAATSETAKRRVGAELGKAWAEDLRSRNVLTSGMLDAHLEEGAEVRLTVRVIRVGESFAICALPGEIFHETGARLQAAALPGSFLLAGYARQSVGYLPTLHAYSEAGYEVGAARLAKGAAEALTEVAERLLRQGSTTK